MPGFGSWFLGGKWRRKTRLAQEKKKNQHYLSVTDIDAADIGKHFQNDAEPRGIVPEMT